MVLALLELGDLVTRLMLAALEDATIVAVSAHASWVIGVVAEVSVGQTTVDAGSSVLIRGPVAVAEVVSVVRHPCVDLISTWLLSLFLWEPVWRLFVISIEGNSWGVSKSLAFCVVLNDLPVFLN